MPAECVVAQARPGALEALLRRQRVREEGRAHLLSVISNTAARDVETRMQPLLYTSHVGDT